MRLRLTNEADILAPVEGPGVGRLVLEPARHADEPALRAWAAEREGGPASVDWRGGGGFAWRGETAVCTVEDAWVAPRTGVVVLADGRVMKSTAAELLTYRRGLGELPGARRDGDGWAVRPPQTSPSMEAASVFLPWGGMFNYGHFLLDALPALEALRQAGALDGAPAVSAPLGRWQRSLLRRAYPEIAVEVLTAGWVRAGRVSFSPAMDHYLRWPGPLTQAVRGRLLAGAAPEADPSVRLYLSRRGLSGRILVNEAELEATLVRRGFTVLHTERMSVEAQADAMARASVIVGASGAAFANVLLAPEACRVVEILPEGFGAPWVRNTCRLIGQDWRGWFAPAPCDPSEAPAFSRLRRGFRFAWRLDLDAFLRWAEL